MVARPIDVGDPHRTVREVYRRHVADLGIGGTKTGEEGLYMVVLSLRMGVHGSELTWRVAADRGRPTLVNGRTERSADRWVGRAGPPPEALAVKCKDDHRAASVPMLSAPGRAHAVGPGRAPVSATPEAAMRLFSSSTTYFTLLVVLMAVALVCACRALWAPLAPGRTRP